jgi:predicted metalloprotease with PDZ domain
MSVNRSLRLSIAAMLASFALMAASAGAAEPVEYELRFGKPSSHLLEITLHANGLKGAAAEFAMPAWAPGSYGINDYAKNVQNFRATDAAGKTLAWRKTDKQTWRVELGGATAVTIQYQLYANTLANNWAQYNEQHAFIGGPAVWMYFVGGKERAVRLVVATPTAWRVATGLGRMAENTFAAADYDTFADAPLEISNFYEKTFTVRGTVYHFVQHDAQGRKEFVPSLLDTPAGATPQDTLQRFIADTQRVVETIVPLYSSVAGGAERAAPFAEYWFLMHNWPGAGGGLEHLNSTQINFSADWSSTAPHGRYGTEYESKLFVTSHEFYHAWNVKRLRPKPLGPFDYSREVYTTSLWISEGLTSYYGQLALVRAGLVKPEAYLNSIAELMTEFEAKPGRAERSIEETSWDTWFRTGVQGETNLTNSTYSYYDGGQIVGHLLDFTIRDATNNQKSLDDWMRLLYQRYALPKAGFEPEDALRAANEVAGKDMSDFFRRHISGKEPLPYEQYFGYAGIQVERLHAPDLGWIGVGTTRNEDGRAKVNELMPGSPAENAGLDRSDVIVALNGRVMDEGQLSKALETLKPGEAVRLAIIRRGELREISVTPVPYPYTVFKLTLMQNPTEMQRKIYESWVKGR